MNPESYQGKSSPPVIEGTVQYFHLIASKQRLRIRTAAARTTTLAVANTRLRKIFDLTSAWPTSPVPRCLDAILSRCQDVSMAFCPGAKESDAKLSVSKCLGPGNVIYPRPQRRRCSSEFAFHQVVMFLSQTGTNFGCKIVNGARVSFGTSIGSVMISLRCDLGSDPR